MNHGIWIWDDIAQEELNWKGRNHIEFVMQCSPFMYIF